MIQALIPSILPAITDVIGRFLPEDKEAKAKAEREIEAQLTMHLAKIDLAQLDINKTEAAHRSIFVAGWRPFIGWSMGIAMTLEDSWGGDITTAAIAHLAHSTPEEFRFTSTDFNSYVTVSTADGAPQRVNGRMAASKSPGLGIKPKLDVLGKRVVVVE